MTILLPITLLLWLIMSRLCLGCPPSCICKWRNGKQSVECVNKSLIIIPEGIDLATQVLDLSGNNFQYLQRDKFLTLGLVNLQKIFLNQCGIKTVQTDSLKGLTNLVELDLSENFLETVPTSALLDCPSLMKLSLSKNPINSLNRLAFNHLSFLTTLDLSGCEITVVHEAAFSSLYSLEWIDLSQNQIKSFPDMRMFPGTLKGLQLQDNPWKCDCNIRTFNAWLKRDIVPVLVPPICRNPDRLMGLAVRALEEVDLACSPEVSSNYVYLELEESKNVTLSCQVKSVPVAKISWLFKGRVLHNNTELTPGLHLVYFLEEGGEEKQSNLFIYNLNSEDNGTFYCHAENSAGIAYANYTIMIILKRKPMEIEEKLEVPMEIVSALFAVGLVMLSLCFVALLMTLIRCHADSKRRKPRSDTKDKFIEETHEDASAKSNFKLTDKRSGLFQPSTGNRNETIDCSYRVSDTNPDVINVINNGEILDPRPRVSGCKIVNNLRPMNMNLAASDATMSRKHPSMLVDATLRHLNLNRRTQPYLKPTLTSQLRPVSAPTFERFIENYDVRYTADGYPVRQVASINLNKSHMLSGSFSEASSPKQALNNHINRLNKVTAQPRKLDEQMMVLDDVQL